MPQTTAEAAEILDRYSDSAKVLAGGQSLVPLLNLRLAQVEHLVDLNRVVELDYIRDDQPGVVTIGALARQRTAERSPAVAAQLGVMPEALSYVGHTQIRNRGTVVGSICHADPAAELPAVWLATGGEATVVSAAGTRTVSADSFFSSYFTTSVQSNELVTEIAFNVANGATGHSVKEVARRHGDFALVGVVAQVSLNESKEIVTEARIALYGVGPTPVNAVHVAELLRGKPVEDGTWVEAASAVGADIAPTGDVHASEQYRRRVASVLTRRALIEASARAAA